MPPVSGSTVRRVPRPACQRFGSSGKPRRHHRRKRGVNARRCVRPCRTGSRPSRRAVRLQGRLTPFESVRQFRPMSAGKDSPPDSGKPRRVPRPACQRFGSRHHRKRRPCAGSERRQHRTRASRPALDRKRRPLAAQPFDRVRRLSAVRPSAPRPASDDSGNIERRHHRQAVRPVSDSGGQAVPPFDRVPPSASDDSGDRAAPCQRATVRAASRFR